jgi:hypothetical protein
MAPNLAASTFAFIHDVIVSNELTAPQMAEAASCNECIIRRLRSNTHLFSSVKAPPNRRGRPQNLMPVMIQALFMIIYLKSHICTLTSLFFHIGRVLSTGNKLLH